MDKSDTVDSYEFVCGLALLSQSSLEDKAKILFDLYDYDKTQKGEETKLAKKVILRSYEWLKYLGNHMIQIRPAGWLQLEFIYKLALQQWFPYHP